MNYITVNDAKIYKKGAEDEILKIIRDLKRSTGLSVEKISYIVTTEQFGDASKIITKEAIDISMKL